MKKLTWYHELGFFNNPFSIKPAAFHNDLMGYDKAINDINKKVDESNVISVKGQYGTGKTTILKKVINEFKGKRKVIYYNCNQSDRSINFDKLLIGAGGFFRRLFRIRKKHMIMLLDEAEDMNKKDMEQVKEYYDEGFFKSVIFVSKENINLTKELEELIGKDKFNTSDINETDAVNMLRKRVGKLKFISDQNIINIFNKNKNPRAFLKNCEDVCRYAFESGAKSVTDKHIRKIVS